MTEQKQSLAARVRALEREMADALDAKMLAKFNLSPHLLAGSVCAQLHAIAAELERIAGEMRSTEGCDTRAEIEACLLRSADALADRKEEA